ncbi:DUF2075 domain-containing protein [Deinococcus ficus]|uniref:DUF2075 domain-containing protein n=1 Tax=Deinococcus ficus TaxID=317577 RepID=UPI00138AC70D|nr:DUF2075 domain-containing protein [Deinococcus ficus]
MPLFVEQALNNEIAGTLRANFVSVMGHNPSPSEAKSWNNSLRELAYMLREAHLPSVYIVLEYKLPISGKRLDVLLTGVGNDGKSRAVIVELKQWDKAHKTDIENMVAWYSGKKEALHLHPSEQAASYASLLQGWHTAFHADEGPAMVTLYPCAFLHSANTSTCGDLLDDRYAAALKKAPLFMGNQRQAFITFLQGHLGHGDGKPTLDLILNSPHKPSKKLLDHVNTELEGQPVYTLIDQQLHAYNLVLSKLETINEADKKAVIIIKGGPGTGKSVIAVRLLGALAREHRTVVHATGSKAFTTNLKATVSKQAGTFFKYFNNFSHEGNETVDVLIADEAHRLRESSNGRYTPKDRRSDRAQVEELIDVAKVSVFLLDARQVVRPGEVGTPDLIEAAAKARGADVHVLELDGQFRCSGSEGYLEWLSATLGLGGAADVSWKDEYEFRLVDSPEALEAQLQARIDEKFTARMVAGFCWKWSKPDKNNELLPDVVIGDWQRPWNRQEKGGEPPHRHPYTIWANQPQGFNEIGCIYSAQGFEFDYCGVIFGPDLVYRGTEWVAVKEASQDTVVKRSKEQMVTLLQNTYRVLMSRGMKGTMVYFMDPETRAYFERALKSQ